MGTTVGTSSEDTTEGPRKNRGLSGAQRKRRRKLRELEEKGTAPVQARTPTYSAGAAAAPGSSVTKRPRPSASSNSTPGTSGAKTPAAKRPRKSGEPTFAAITKDLPRVAVSVDGYPERNLSDEQHGLLYEEVRKAVLSAGRSVGPLRFEGVQRRVGTAVFVCADEATADWLRETVPKLKPWEDSKLTLVDLEKLLKLKRARVFIPGPLRESKTVLEQLETQNRGLNTSRWVVHGRGGVSATGFCLALGVDEPSIEVLRTLSFKPYLDLGRVTVKVQGLG